MEQQRLQLENQQHLNTINTLYERIGPGEFDASKVKVARMLAVLLLRCGRNENKRRDATSDAAEG